MIRKERSKKKIRISLKTYSIKWSRFLPVLIALLVTPAVAFYLILSLSKNEFCKKTELSLSDSVPKLIQGQVLANQTECYEFRGTLGQKLILTTNQKIKLISPSSQFQNLQGNYQTTLAETGKYSLVLETQEVNLDYQINLTVSSPSAANLPQETSVNNSFSRNSQSLSSPLTPQFSNFHNQIIYNVRQSPPFYNEKTLQEIVNSIVSLAQSRKLPIEKLSVSLVDLNQSRCCAYAVYQDKEFRYPASVVKLFWLVVLYSQYYAQGIEPNQIPPDTLKIISKMIKDSDNEAASLIFDQITQTKSSKKELPPEKLKTWINNRYVLNSFFELANYSPVNISQKTFPIPNLLIDPAGPDKQIRQINGKKNLPVRNFLNTYSVARLLYEIDRNQAISPAYSQAIKQLIKRDLRSQSWKEKPFNPIEGFFGQSLPVQTKFYAKMGWTFNNRNDAAIVINSKEAHYILVVFGDDAKYYKDKDFFPLLSRQVYNQMLKK